jgi:hypothetical protein
MVRLKGPFGAGSQLASLPVPGLSFWKYRSSQPSGLKLERHPAADGEAIEGIGDLKSIWVVKRDRPESAYWRDRCLVEMDRISMRAVERLPGLVGKIEGIDRILRYICPEALPGDDRAF